MNSDRDFETAAAEWLHAGSDTTPPHVVDAVLLAAKSTPQERDYRVPWMTPPTKRLAYAMAAVAALAVGVTALSALSSGFGIGPRPTPAAQPSVDLGIFAPVAGWIVYGDEHGIWGVDPAAPTDPATRVQLTSGAGNPLGWSSDGTRLLVMRDELLFVLHSDGSETQLTERPMAIRGAAISPDGSRVVFATIDGAGNTGFLFAVEADGGPAEILLELDGLEGVSFSPDGTRIAYVSGRGDSSHRVSVMDADGTNPREILANGVTLDGGHDHGIAWSPAGDRIALGIEGIIYTFAPDGSGFTEALVGGRHQPFWSPDGSQLETRGPWHPGTAVPIFSPSSTDASGATPNEESELRRDGEVIVFEPRGPGKDWDLAAQDPETGEVRTIVETDRITDCPDVQGCASFVRSAEWSPDGRRLAFQVSHASLDGPPVGPCGPTVGLWVTNALGDLRQLTTPCDLPPPRSDVAIQEVWAWSPAGDRLVYARVDGGVDELFIIDPTDGARTSLGTTDGNVSRLAWSPDGARIAYADGGSVHAIGADGGEPSLLAASFDDIVDLAWSPEGTRILAHDRGRYRIQIMNADGSDLHILLEGKDACCSTTWSPSGDRILYMLSVVRPGEGESGLFDSQVWTVSPDGSNLIEVFDSDGCDMGEMGFVGDSLPVWSPDGTQVAYNDCGAWVVAGADGTGRAQPLGGAPSGSGGPPLVHRSWDGGGLSQWDLAIIGQVDH